MTLYFLLDKQYSKYYDQSGNLVATSFDDLLNWFQTQQNVRTAAEIKEYPGMLCSVYKIIAVTGYPSVPGFIHGDGVYPNNRIVGKTLSVSNPNFNNLCNGIVDSQMCAIPVTDTILVQSASCATPTTDTILVVAINAIYAISNGGNFTVDTSISSASKTGNTVNMTLRTTYASQSGSLSDAIIATIGSDITPAYDVVLTHADQSNIPSGSSLHIDTSGNVRWTGPTNVGSTTIAFSNIIYNLTYA